MTGRFRIVNHKDTKFTKSIANQATGSQGLVVSTLCLSALVVRIPA